MNTPASVEVTVFWGSNQLRVDHVVAPGVYSIGEQNRGEPPCDFAAPPHLLGARRAPVVLASRDGARVVLLRGARGTFESPVLGTLDLSRLIADGRARPCPALPGAHELELSPGSTVRTRLEGSELVLQMRMASASDRTRSGILSGFDAALWAYLAMAALLHLGILGTLAHFMPRPLYDDIEGTGRADMTLIQRLLGASDEDAGAAVGEKGVPRTQLDRAGEPLVGKTERSRGRPDATRANDRYGVAGPADNADPHIARAAALREAAEFGMIGLLRMPGPNEPHADDRGGVEGPTAQWARDDALGNDSRSASGNMWGDAIGDSLGSGGLGISGTGEGSGGQGVGIGIGGVGTVGRGSGMTGQGQGFGCGCGHGRIGGAHRTRSPVITVGGTTVSGRLPPEVIQRIVRQNFGRFRLCYEDGLRNRPSLEGRVSVKFVIDRTGSVPIASDAGSDLADEGVVSCVVRGFENLSFPEPQGGIVTVVYPIVFSEGG
jgi:hypothetical protein